MSDEERIRRITERLRELHKITDEAREEILTAAEQLLAIKLDQRGAVGDIKKRTATLIRESKELLDRHRRK